MIKDLFRADARVYVWRVLFIIVLLFTAAGLALSDYVREIHAYSQKLASAYVVQASSPLATPTATAGYHADLPSPPTGSSSPLRSPSVLERLVNHNDPTVTAVHSPLVTPESVPDYPQVEEKETDYGVSLPTPTLTPETLAAVAAPSVAPISVQENMEVTSTVELTVTQSVSVTEAVSATEAITELLDLPVVSVSYPDPTPAPLPPPTLAPDGMVRTARIPILMYHYLSTPPTNADIYRLDLSVTRELFAQHLDAIQEAGYTAITLYDLVNHLTQGAPLPARPVVITFDDGYVDNYRNALPLLRERNMKATFFVVTDFIDDERPEYINWDMAREMLDAGMNIESHGRNHVSLQHKDYDYLVWQALGSLETIEYELAVRPRFVSYPAGQYDQATKEVFESAGYWAGVTTVQGATHHSDALFDLRRVRVRGTTSSDELLRLMALEW